MQKSSVFDLKSSILDPLHELNIKKPEVYFAMAQKVFQGDLYHVNSYAFDLRWLNFEMTKNFDHVIYFRDGSHSQNNSIFEISSFAEFFD